MLDVYYVTNSLHRISLTLSPPYKPYLYELKNHRTFKAPKFRDQRKIIKTLAENSIIELLGSYNRYGKETKTKDAVSFKFRRVGKDDNLRQYAHMLLVELQEARMNYIAIHEKEKLELVYEDGYIYVLTPLLKLRVNKLPLRAKAFPDTFFSYLIDTVKGQLLIRANCPYLNSRGYDEICNKAGFSGVLKAIFIPVVDKNKVQLLTKTETSLKNIQFLTRELLELEYDPMIYESYLDGIE